MTASILDQIGNTPMVEIRRLNPNPKVKILAKLEYLNPGGSVKDRPALFMIEEGERSGQLTPDKTVIEATSGNTGIGLAMVCSIKGYKLLLTMSEGASMERRKILAARGAQIKLTPAHLGTDGAIEEVYRMARENPDKYFMADQFNNPANWMAHYETTAPEIWRDTKGEITHMVATLGTSGTLMGLARRLKEYNPEIQVIGVEPYLGHKLQGLKNMKEAYVPEIFEKKRLDIKINMEDEPAYEMARQLAKEEGLFVGMSSGAAMRAALDQAANMDSGTMVVLLPDSGERYLSTPLFTVREKVEMGLFNIAAKKIEPLSPRTPGKISMYTVGPTAVEPMDLSQSRRFIFADLLRRYLEHRGFEVRHVINVTDLDDRTIAASEEAGMELADFTRQYEELFLSDLEKLGCLPADDYPKTSEHIGEMVELAEKLAQKGFAYEKLRSLYFDVSRLEGYGELSGVDLNKIRLGATVDLDEYEKDNPRDFTLFKRSRLAELRRGIFIKTPWGNARPSWHVQCAAISLKLLGENFDLHVSSRELLFPHHENEDAIARAATGKSLARSWLLAEGVFVEESHNTGEGARLTLKDLADQGFTPRDVRYWLLSGQYHRPLTFSPERLENAKSALARLDRFTQSLAAWDGGRPYGEINQLVYDLKNGVQAALDDDMAVPTALSEIFSTVKTVNTLMAEGGIDADGAGKILDALKKINQVLNIFTFPQQAADPEVEALIQQREEARKNKDYAKADAIRDQLLEKGVQVQDNKA